LLYVDGNHQEVAADLDAWLPHVVPGGIVGVHDNNLPSVINAVTARDDIVEFERADLSTFYRKEPLHEEFTYDGIPMWVAKGRTRRTTATFAGKSEATTSARTRSAR
jgi:hypothetical protein